MVEVTIRDFGGKIPRRSKRLLPGNFAQEAVNTKLLSGELRGVRAPLLAHSFTPGTNPKRAFRIIDPDDGVTEYWVAASTNEAELVRSPLTNDAFNRWYLFEKGQPARVYDIQDIRDGTGPWNVAFTQPTTAPTLTPTVFSSSNVRDVVYVYTYVTDWGEESAPSPPATVSVDDAGSVEVSDFYTPAPSVSGRAFEYVRIYRSITFAGQAVLFYVDQISWGTTTYTDTLPDVQVSLNEQLPSALFTPPPDGLYGARTHPSGALVAFKGRDVWFSEPYRPNAWPDVYKVSVEDAIVAIEVWEQNVGIFTQGRPYLVYGPEPSQVGLLRFAAPEPCVSYNSVVGTPEGAYYASNQGLTLFTAVGPQNVTRELISEEEWNSDYLDSRLSAARYGTQYIGFNRPTEGFIIDNQEPRIALTDLLFTGPAISSLEEDPYSGRIYALAGDNVYEWDPTSTEEVDYIWKSKQEVLDRPVNMGSVMVHIEPRAAEYVPSEPLPNPPFPTEYSAIDKRNEVLVEVYMNDEKVASVACRDREQVRLPSGEKGDAWEVRVIGQCRLYSVALTETGRGQGRAG